MRTTIAHYATSRLRRLSATLATCLGLTLDNRARARVAYGVPFLSPLLYREGKARQRPFAYKRTPSYAPVLGVVSSVVLTLDQLGTKASIGPMRASLEFKGIE